MPTPTMSFEMRLALLVFNGVQAWPGARDLALYTDAVTGSTFAIEPGQTVGQGLAAFILRWNTLSGDEGSRMTALSSPDHREERTA